jgi:HK97 family phage portal protein
MVLNNPLATIVSVFARRPPVDKRVMTRPSWWSDIGGSTATSSGKTVDEIRAYNYSVVYCGVSLITGTLKVLPAGVFKELDGGGKEKQRTHRAHKALTRRPNREQTPSQFREFLQACAILWGNGYAVIGPLLGNGTIELFPVHPRFVQIERRGDQWVYLVRNPQTQMQTAFPAERMIHIRNLSRDGIVGMSLFEVAAETIGLGLATEQHGATYFGNGAKPGGVIEHPETMEDDEHQAFREEWERMFRGSANANRTAILERGMSYKSIGLPNDVSQFLETRMFEIEEWARWINVPPHKLKQLQHAKLRATVEEQNIEFVGGTILPWTVNWEEELDAKLLTPKELDDGYSIKFNVKGLLRGDIAARGDFYQKMWSMGAYSANHMLELEDENPIGPEGDKHLVQLNLTTLDKVGEEEPEPEPAEPVAPAVPQLPEPEPDEEEESRSLVCSNLFADAFGRIVRREVDRLKRSVKKFAGDLDGLRSWSEEFYSGPHRRFVADALEAPTAAVYRTMVMGALRSTEPWVAIERLIDEMAEDRGAAAVEVLPWAK